FWTEGKKGSPEESDASPLPAELLAMLDDFSENIAKLTSTERKIVSYYLDGYDIASLPELMNISINTVRKHNRSIYQKLHISSREELMVYLDILDRCGRLEPIENLLKEDS
ncbi:MAG: helix-turn-helix transcriptional regulator, partial [Bulleidia sp.]